MVKKKLNDDSLQTLQSLAWISKEYNTQDQLGAWGMDINLLNHIKN